MLLAPAILSQIDPYLIETGMSRHQFGLKAVADGKFLGRLKDGRVTVRSAQRALDFISAEQGKSANDNLGDPASPHNPNPGKETV